MWPSGRRRTGCALSSSLTSTTWSSQVQSPSATAVDRPRQQSWRSDTRQGHRVCDGVVAKIGSKDKRRAPRSLKSRGSLGAVPVGFETLIASSDCGRVAQTLSNSLISSDPANHGGSTQSRSIVGVRWGLYLDTACLRARRKHSDDRGRVDPRQAVLQRKQHRRPRESHTAVEEPLETRFRSHTVFTRP